MWTHWINFAFFSSVFCVVSEAAGRGCSKIRVSLCVGLLLWFTNVYKFAIWEAITVGAHQLRYAANWVTRTLRSSLALTIFALLTDCLYWKMCFTSFVRVFLSELFCKDPTPNYRVFEFHVILMSAIWSETNKILQFYNFIVSKFLFFLFCVIVTLSYFTILYWSIRWNETKLANYERFLQ